MKLIDKIIVLIVLVGIFFLGRCTKHETETTPQANPLISILSKLNDSLSVEAVKMKDSYNILDKELTDLKSKKPTYVVRYEKTKDLRSEITSDSVKSVQIFDSVTSACDSLLDLNDSIITDHERKDSVLVELISNQNKQLDNKDQIIDLYFEQVKTDSETIRKHRRRTVIVSIGGFILGGAVGVIAH